MVVDKYVGRCLDVGSTPTGSIIPLHSFAFLGKTLLNQRFLFLSLVFLGILLRKKHTTKESQTAPKADLIFEEGLLCYVTISPSRSVRCETKQPPAMRVRVEGYTKKTPNAIQ